MTLLIISRMYGCFQGRCDQAHVINANTEWESGKVDSCITEFDLKYESAKAVKGQIMADFVTQHHKPSIDYVEPIPWMLFFDGSSCKQGGGIGIVIISPRGGGKF